VKIIKAKYLSILLLSAIVLISLNCAAASENITDNMQASDYHNTLQISENDHLQDASSSLESKIVNAKNNDTISLKPGTYKIHNIQITKNITIQGKGDPRDIIIDGENKSSIFLIRSGDVHVAFKNITFINGLTDNFGGAISIETGHVTVDNCMFINNTALNNTNAGGISNYGTKYDRGYLLVNNSLFINNHADHDGGAITTCYANSYIYNCVFINNSAHRDGGAIRVSVFGFGDVQDCIFMFNHADEWGGAYYSWSGTSDVKRCIFLNNTAGTNGGAVMASGDLNLQESIIMNNDGGETGGSFYIQQPMYNQKTVMNVHDNLITNNSSPYGQEIFIKWKDSYNLFTQFDNNDWGSEDPNDSSVIDPNNVTPRSKVSKTIKSDLFTKLNIDLLDKYSDLLEDYFPDNSLNDLKNQFKKPDDNKDSKKAEPSRTTPETEKTSKIDNVKTSINSTTTTANANNYNLNTTTHDSQNIVAGNSTSSVGEATNDKNAYEINETPSVSKKAEPDLKYFIVLIAFTLILLAIGYKRNSNKE
jgi:predicted outer membrane repeat protein